MKKDDNNIRTNNQQLSKLMLISEFICQLLFSTTYPYLYAATMKQITDKYISVNTICICLSTIIVNCLWNKYSDKLFEYYAKVCTLESIAYIVCIVLTISTEDLKLYYVSDTIITSVITRHIVCGRVKLKAKIHPTDKEREKFDNNDNTASAIACVTGSLASMVLSLDINTLLIICCIGSVIDNFSYTYIWKIFNNERKKKN